LHSGVAEAVISGALLRIAENAVRLAAFLELLFGIGIVRVPVGMKALRQVAVSGLQFRIGCLFSDTEYFVIISL
jgi:hypothetical protein